MKAPSARRRVGRAIPLLVLVLLTAVIVLAGATVAYADAYCESCHKAGGLASNPAAHPVPPYGPAWDPSDGQCTVCHEWDSSYAPDYQHDPYGPVSIDDSGDHYYIRDTLCRDCHTGDSAHGGTISFPLPATINLVGSQCTECHTTGMHVGEVYEFSSPVPQVNAATHGDPGTAHAPAVSQQCTDCHGSDLTALHGECTVCHGAGPVDGKTCVSCHPTYTSGHGFPLYGGGYNPNATGYLSWSYVKAQTGAIDSPHGNYSTTTNKCAVCHAVHRADPDGVVLTAWGGKGSASPAFSSTMAPFESCFFCHGNGATFTDKTVEFFVTSGGSLSPHTTCGRCHTASPHGAGTSEYAVLSAKLINDHADPQLDVDLRDGNNGLTADMFDLSDSTKVEQGTTLATGYLCVGCHGSDTNEHVFAVNERGATPAIHYTSNPPAPGDDAAPGNVTGHQVWIGASSNWNLDGSAGAWYSGGGPHDYYLAIYRYQINGVWRHFKVAGDGSTFNEVTSDGATVIGGPYTSAQVAAMGVWDSTIAYNNAYGCGTCHDATRTNGKLAFPHGYVNAAGAPAPKWSNRTEPGAIMDPDGYLQTSLLWLTLSGDADDARVIARTNGNNNIDANRDGACLKCHLSGDRKLGIGADRPEWGDVTPPPPADNVAPTTSAAGVVNGGTYPAPVTITLNAADNSGGSGVATTYYTLNGGATQTGTSVQLTTAGAYTLSYWSTDVAGNAETPKSVSFTVTAIAQTGTVVFYWYPATPGSYATYYVRDAANNVVATGYGEYGVAGWDGRFYVTVPVSPQAYQLSILWYDPNYEDEEFWTYGTALIDTPGKEVQMTY